MSKKNKNKPQIMTKLCLNMYGLPLKWNSENVNSEDHYCKLL